MADAKAGIPRNVREVVLQGFDLHAGCFTATDSFTGPHTIVRRGEVQPDGADFEIPFTASIKFDRPRPTQKGGRS
jgi:hypothetical protein